MGRRGDDGAVSTEYALLILFIAVAIAAVVGAFGGMVGDLFTSSTDTFP